MVLVSAALASNSSQAHELSDSIFNHMFRYESAVQARRRALMLVDVLVVSGQGVRSALSNKNASIWEWLESHLFKTKLLVVQSYFIHIIALFLLGQL